MTSVRGEETEVLRRSLESRLESIPPLEESRDRLGAYSGRCGEEVRRFQETADLGPRRTRTRGSQGVTAADKSEVVHVVRDVRQSHDQSRRTYRFRDAVADTLSCQS